MTEENTQEMTIREATIYSLTESEKEFINMKESFQQIADKFDAGEDSEALTMIKDELINKISALYEYCYSLVLNFDKVIPKDLHTTLTEKLKAIDELNNSLITETEAGNFTEVGDILRFDFYDLITDFSSFFPKLIECFKNSEVDGLDEY